MIRVLDQRLGRYPDQSHGFGHCAGGAPDQGHHAGVGATIDKNCAGRPTCPEQTAADQLGQL